MLCFFLIASVDQNLGSSVPQRVSQRILQDQRSVVPYSSFGLVKAYFRNIKLQKKERTDYSYFEIDSNFHTCGSGFLVQQNVVMTAAHVIMPDHFNLEKSWFAKHVDFKNREQLPYKVEFYPFYPYRADNANSDCVMTRNIVPEVMFDQHLTPPAPGDTAENNNHKKDQKFANKYFIVPTEWKTHLHDKTKNPSYDYAVLSFPEKTAIAPPIKILKDFNKTGKPVSVVGFPSYFYSDTGTLEKNEELSMFEVFGQTIPTFSPQIGYDCQAYSGLSGGAIIEKESNRIIGLHTTSIKNGDGTRGNRYGIKFTPTVIAFIQDSLKERKITSNLMFEQEDAPELLPASPVTVVTAIDQPPGPEPFNEDPSPIKKEDTKCKCPGCCIVS